MGVIIYENPLESELSPLLSNIQREIVWDIVNKSIMSNYYFSTIYI